MKDKIIIFIVALTCLIALIIVNNKSYALSDNVEKTWNISFDNLKASIINGNAYVPVEPELEATSIKAYDVLISKRGDSATFTFDVVNSGDIDAKLQTFSKLEPTCVSLAIPGVESDAELVCNNLEYKITYTKDGKEVSVNDIIKAHSKENITMQVGFSEFANAEPSNDVQITLYDMNLIYNHSN